MTDEKRSLPRLSMRRVDRTDPGLTAIELHDGPQCWARIRRGSDGLCLQVMPHAAGEPWRLSFADMERSLSHVRRLFGVK
ncbi:MAG: hypothetical protein AAF290_05240 [Pseudomonadota bacterium]|mgnify:CR=1 FL=1